MSQRHTGFGRVVRRVGLIALGAVGIALGGCKRGQHTETAGGDVGPAWTPRAADAIVGVPAAEVTGAIQSALTSRRPAAVNADRWKHVQRLYAAYRGVPLWLESDGFNADRTQALLRAVVDANTDALRLDGYPLEELVGAVTAVRSGHSTAEQLATADVLLTSAYVALAEDLLSGQVDPKSLSQDWHISAGREAVDSAVARSLREPRLDSAIARMRPRDADYDALRRALVRFRALAANGWPTVPEGKALKPGQSDSPARLAALRERLRAEGFGAPAESSTAAAAAAVAVPAIGAARGTAAAGVYDRALAGQVAQFQAHHGIAVDSILGAETVKSLNVPASFRLGQIAANLERYRWLPRAFGDRYILVNVPAFRLEAHDTGQRTLEMKVIVGQEYEGKKTPVFSDSMETVVFRPYWLITPDIQAKETEPKIAADPGYMAANDLEYYRDHGETRIRQKPGDKNSLGLVKFLFPNSFNIYLHDTPQRELFNKDVRAFSHGCIRLEKPAELAQWVLGWDAARVEQAMHGKDNQSVKVPRPVPVYITYFTAYTRDDVLHFGNDLYDRDASLVQAMTAGAGQSGETVRAVETLRKLVAD